MKNSHTSTLRRQHIGSRGRRRFLALAGSGLVGGIALRLDREARGQLSTTPRFIHYNHCNSLQTVHLNRSDVSSPDDFELGTFMTEFEAHKADLTVIQRMHCSPGGFNHGNLSSALSCTQRGDKDSPAGAGLRTKIVGGPTIDQVIADHLHGTERLRTLVLGHALATKQDNCTQGTIVGRAEDDPIFPTIDPVKAHETVFGVGGGQDEVLVALEQSYLDFVKDDIQAFNAELPTFEKQKFEQYLESVRDVERSLGGLSAASCSGPPVQRFPSAKQGTTQNHPEYWAFMTDLGVAALQCGSTRQLTLLHSFGCIHLKYTFDGTTKNDHGEVCHKEESGAFRERILRFHASHVANIYDRLKNIPEGAGTMADNTLLAWTSDGGGSHHKGNVHHNMVYLGRGNGALKGGRWIKLAEKQYPLGSAHITSALAMGLELETFGDGSDDVDRPISEVLA